MSKLSKFLRSASRKIQRPISKFTGHHAASQQKKEIKAQAEETARQTAELEEKTKREQKKAAKIKTRGFRSRRSASRLRQEESPAEGIGSATIG